MKLPPLINTLADLSAVERTRYSRHILLPDIGLKGQQRLKASRVLVIGAGGLGSPTLLYLAAAGVGTLGIVDFDRVDVSNLQRQIIHKISTVGALKTDSARQAIVDLNPFVEVRLHKDRLDNDNVLQLLDQYDVIVDGTDNFATRYLVNDACVLTNKPYVWGSIYRFEGQTTVFWENAPGNSGVNYRDLYPEPPPPALAPSCSEGGVLGVLCAAIASIMATEVIKLITGAGESLLGRLGVYDALAMSYRFIPLRRDPERKPILALQDYQQLCGLNISSEPSSEVASIPKITATELKQLLDAGDSFDLIDVREPGEWDLVHIPGAQLVPKQKLNDFKNLIAAKKDLPIVMYCKAGSRSRDAAQSMRDSGFTNVRNLEGGVLAWVRLVDSSLPTY